MVQVVFYGEKNPIHPLTKEREGKALESQCCHLVEGMPGAYINTGFFSVKRNEFKFFVGQNVLELGGAAFAQYKRCQFQKAPGLPGC